MQLRGWSGESMRVFGRGGEFALVTAGSDEARAAVERGLMDCGSLSVEGGKVVATPSEATAEDREARLLLAVAEMEFACTLSDRQQRQVADGYRPTPRVMA